MSFNPGDVIADKYRIVGMIGRGGVGEVYEGENIRIRRRVAIKTLRGEFVTKLDIVQRFEREAQAAGRIGSKHIVEVLDLGDLPDGSRYLVMEHLEGQTLSRQIKTLGRMTAIDTAQLLVQLLEGLGAAHTAGIIHRDLKPANIFLTRKAGENFVKVLDFGVSKFNTLASDELSMTKTGVVVGTPYYMAPEQAKGDRGVDGRADLYAVGVIAYECVTGQVPFSAQTFNELLFKIVLEAPPPVEKFAPDLDPHFASLVRKAMAREPNMRFQTAAELQSALSDWLVGVTGGKLGTTLAQTTSFSRDANAATTILGPGDAPTAQVAAAVAAARGAGPPPFPGASGPVHPAPANPAPPGPPPPAPLPEGAVGVGAQGPSQPWETSSAEPARRRSLLPWVIGGAGLLAVAAVAVAAVLGRGDGGDTASASTAPPSSAAPSEAEPPQHAPGTADPTADPPVPDPPVPGSASPVVEAQPIDTTPVPADPPAGAPPATAKGRPAAPPRPPPPKPPPPKPPATSSPNAGRPISGDL